MAEQSDDSDFEARPVGASAKSKNQQRPVASSDIPVVMIPMPTKTFEKMLDYRINQRTGQPELLVKYKVSWDYYDYYLKLIFFFSSIQAIIMLNGYLKKRLKQSILVNIALKSS